VVVEVMVVNAEVISAWVVVVVAGLYRVRNYGCVGVRMTRSSSFLMFSFSELAKDRQRGGVAVSRKGRERPSKKSLKR